MSSRKKIDLEQLVSYILPWGGNKEGAAEYIIVYSPGRSRSKCIPLYWFSVSTVYFFTTYFILQPSVLDVVIYLGLLR